MSSTRNAIYHDALGVQGAQLLHCGCVCALCKRKQLASFPVSVINYCSVYDEVWVKDRLGTKTVARVLMKVVTCQQSRGQPKRRRRRPPLQPRFCTITLNLSLNTDTDVFLVLSLVDCVGDFVAWLTL